MATFLPQACEAGKGEVVGESISEYLPNGATDLAAPSTHLPGNTQLVCLVWGGQAFAVPSWDVGFVVTKILLLG
ncbi:MAG: hypothetical protein ACPG77_16970, partial [Nannocystaceae bacterium]